MRRLWGRMASMYGGARWASAASALPVDAETGQLTLAADTWSQALAGISEAQIGDGLRACMASGDEYVPTPMLFRARCMGIPSLAFVRLSLRDNRLVAPTPFVRLVWSLIDAYAMARATQSGANRMMQDAYQLASEHVMRGGELPDDPVASIEAPKADPRTPCTAETAQRSIDAMAQVFGLGSTSA